MITSVPCLLRRASTLVVLLGSPAWAQAVTSTSAPEGEATAAVPLSDPDLRVEDVAALAMDRARHDRVRFIDDPDDLWVRGRTYKANATPDGFAYFPFLGSDAPRTWPVSFRLERATVGSVDLALEERAVVSRTEQRIDVDRGPVNVHYDVGLDGVEQLFTFDEEFRDGAITLELAIETDLSARPDGRGFAFDGPWGGVRYGAAEAFDGMGRRIEVPAELADGRLVLRVPASFVASSTGAVTVDPMVWTVTAADHAVEDLLNPDVAFEATTNQFVVVFESRFAGNDTDIDLITLDAADGSVTSMDSFTLGGLDELNPSVGTLNAHDLALVAYEDFFVGGTNSIEARMYTLDTYVRGSSFFIRGPSQRPHSPKVGGSATDDPAAPFLVAYIRDLAAGRPRAFYKPVAADMTVGADAVAVSSALRDDLEIALSESSGDGTSVHQWNLVVRSVDHATGQTSIHGSRIAPDGLDELGGEGTLRTFPLGTTVSGIDVSDARPATDVNGNALPPTYLASWGVGGPNGGDTILAVCREDAIVSDTHLQVIEHADIGLEQRHARLALTRDAFAVSYLEERPGEAAWDVFMTALHLVEGSHLAVMERRLHLGDTGEAPVGPPAMASRRSGGYTTSRRAITAWAKHRTASGTADWVIDGAYYYTPVTDSVALQYCYGTPNSTGERAFMAIFGSNDTTTPKEAVGTGIPPLQFCLLGVGTLPVQVFPVPNSAGTLCIGGQVGRFNGQIAQADANGRVAVTIDPTAIPTPTDTEAAMAGMKRGFQFWYRDVGAGGASTSNFTNGAALAFR